MVGGLSWATVRQYKRVLIVCPQDLIPQWEREALEKFGIRLRRIRTPEEARLLSKTPKPDKPEYYIIHYEALSRNGRTEEIFPELEWRNAKGIYTSKERCPHCHCKTAWTGTICNPRVAFTVRDENDNTIKRHGCGHTNYKRRVYNAAHWLKHTFSGIIIDEGTKIKGDNSLMGLAARSLHAKGRLILTGTPIKNFLHDSYWLLFWAAGGTASASFPYGYNDKDRFVEDFCVLEWEKAQQANGYTKGAKRTRPEISNISMLWKTISPNILRRRKSETGENLVSKRLVPIRVPFGTQQQSVYRWWLSEFGDWYAARPDTEIQSSRIATALAGILGQLWKLRQVATIPALDRLADHNGMQGTSNFTPKLYTCLELIREALEAREAVVVFNTMKAANRLLEEELRKAGVRCKVVDGETKPAARAAIMQEFKAGKFQVLLAGLEAVALGHNLENARRAIVFSLPYDFAGFDQAINRIHRLTSTKDVVVYALLTEGSIDEKMWDLISRKGASAGLALDGALGFDDVEEIDWNRIAAELREDFEETSSISESTVESKIAHLWNGLTLLTAADGSQIGAAAGLLDSVNLNISNIEL